MPLSPRPRVAVIGAGMAGLTCARLLSDRGLQPIIFEKSRGLGGRLATRRLHDGIALDHGAPYFTARHPKFERLMDEALQTGAAGYWNPQTPDTSPATTARWIVGQPTMNALVKPLAAGLDLRLATQVTGLHRSSAGWEISVFDREAPLPFDAVVCTIPAPQACALLTDEGSIREALGAVRMSPCWALMIAFEAPVGLGFDAWPRPSPDLAWIARNGSKPLRQGTENWLVVHASPTWSQDHLEQDREAVAELMVELLKRALGAKLPNVTYRAAHRWRYAQAVEPLGRLFLQSDDGTLLVGGDWCLGTRVESAFESGTAMAQAVISQLPR